jgi:hypothetical protein
VVVTPIQLTTGMELTVMMMHAQILKQLLLDLLTITSLWMTKREILPKIRQLIRMLQDSSLVQPSISKNEMNQVTVD